MNYYEVKAISNSSMSFLSKKQGGSRLRYHRKYIEFETKDQDSESMIFGRTLHAYVEDPSKFTIADIDKPSEMMAKWVEAVYQNHGFGNLNYTILRQKEKLELYKSTKKEETVIAKFEKEGKAYYDYLVMVGDKDPNFVLTTKQKELIENCVSSLKANPNTVAELFEKPEEIDRYNEFELFWTSEETGLECKGMIDILDINHSAKTVKIKDFKTTSKQLSKYPEAFEYWRTYRQLAFYAHGLRNVMSAIKDYNIEFQVIAIETTGINECRVFNISKEWIMTGREEYQCLLREIKAGHDCNWSSEFVYENETI